MSTQFKANHTCDICGKQSGDVVGNLPNVPQVPVPAGWSKVSQDIIVPPATYSTNIALVLCDTHTAQFVTWRTTPQPEE